MLKARVLGIPHIEDGEVVFAVWVQCSSSAAEIVQVTTPDRATIHVEAHGHTSEVADAAKDEVERWIDFQSRFVGRLYARLHDQKRSPIQSHVREMAPSTGGRASVAPSCALCAGTGESEKFLDRSDGHGRWAFGPKVSEAPLREKGSFVPCPACRRFEYDESVERSVSSDSLSGELERVEAIVTGRTATIRERLRSVAPKAHLSALPRARRS